MAVIKGVVIMARPKNLLVQRGTTVVSTTHKALKTFLSAVAAGTQANLTGKVLGDTTADLTGVNATVARTMLAQMFPEPTPTEEPTPALVVITVPPS
jgi:hypothetical protein